MFDVRPAGSSEQSRRTLRSGAARISVAVGAQIIIILVQVKKHAGSQGEGWKGGYISIAKFFLRFLAQGPALCLAAFPDHKRLSPGYISGEIKKLPSVFQALYVRANDLSLFILSKVVQKVMTLQIAGVSIADDLAEAEPFLTALTTLPDARPGGPAQEQPHKKRRAEKGGNNPNRDFSRGDQSARNGIAYG